MVSIEIIAIGNELLLGDVLDSNTYWLCRKFTGLGGYVLQAAMVRDDPQAIIRTLRDALQRETQLVITTGGLGPTEDDLTLQAIASALDRPLEIHPTAYKWVEEKYRRLAAEGFVQDATMTESRIKMARLPRGATPIFNPVGAAPAVLIDFPPSRIICLPGVPSEMKGIFEESLTPVWREMFGEGVFLEKMLIVGCQDESVLAPILSQVGQRHPEVYIKSRAKHFGPGVRFRVTLSLAGRSRQSVMEILQDTEQDLKAAFASIGIPVEVGEMP